MPWEELVPVAPRVAFVLEASAEGANITRLCAQYGICRKTGYKWLGRYQEGGEEALVDASRRPHSCPHQTPEAMETAVLAVRSQHPTWGPRKIRALLQAQGLTALPSPSTVSAILKRAGCVTPEEATKHRPLIRFEHEAPNELWQLDFLGPLALGDGSKGYLLSVLDDCSRYCVGLYACPDQTYRSVRGALEHSFGRWGLPEAMLMDNGSPWGDDGVTRHTIFTTWLQRLGIAVRHGRPYHPQTQGKVERFHRTLREELLRARTFADLEHCQQALTRWQAEYNTQRPHEALGLEPPCSVYSPSPRPLPAELPGVVYEPGEVVRWVDAAGRISFRNRAYRIGKAFRHQPVALREGAQAGQMVVYYGASPVVTLDLAQSLR